MDRSKRTAAEKGDITAYVGWLIFAFLAITIAFATHCSGAELTPAARASYKVFCAESGHGGSATGIAPWLLVSNAHVVTTGQRVSVSHTVTGESHDGQVVAHDKRPDISLIYVASGALSYVPLGDDPAVGESLTVYGYGMARNLTTDSGRVVSVSGRRSNTDVPAIDLDIYGENGDSGCGFFDSDNRLCAVMWGGDGRVCTATPVSYVRSVGGAWAEQYIPDGLRQKYQIFFGPSCSGGVCDRPRIIPVPRQNPRQPVSATPAQKPITTPAGKPCDCDESRIIAAVLAVLKREISSGELTEALRGAPGRDGKDGRDGTDADLGALTDEQIEEIAQRVRAQIQGEIVFEYVPD